MARPKKLSQNGTEEVENKKPRKPRGQTISVRVFRMKQINPTDPIEYFVFLGTKVKRHFQVDPDSNNPNPLSETALGMMVERGAMFPSREIVNQGIEVAKMTSSSPMIADEIWRSASVIKLIEKLHLNYLEKLAAEYYRENPEQTPNN